MHNPSGLERYEFFISYVYACVYLACFSTKKERGMLFISPRYVRLFHPFQLLKQLTDFHTLRENVGRHHSACFIISKGQY